MINIKLHSWGKLLQVNAGNMLKGETTNPGVPFSTHTNQPFFLEATGFLAVWHPPITCLWVSKGHRAAINGR